MTDRDDAEPPGPDAAADGAARTAVALRRLRPPDHGASFWTDLDTRLADEPQLRLAPRAAIRPITQPPPVIDDRNLASSLAAAGPARPRRSSRRLVIGGVVAVLVALIVAAAIQGPNDDKAATSPPTTADTSAGRTPTSGQTGPQVTTAPSTATPPGQVEQGAKLEPAGVGPLRVGQTLGQLQAAGVAIQPDMATYNGTGGRCYGGKVAGALDLELRFRKPDGQRRATDPTQGVLAAIGVETALPTFRQSNTGIGLGAPQNAVLAAYGGNLDQRDHPFVPGGKIFRADAGNGLGIAYLTDGQTVIGITVGEMNTIRFVHQCG